jgi:hypothetical protein
MIGCVVLRKLVVTVIAFVGTLVLSTGAAYSSEKGVFVSEEDVHFCKSSLTNAIPSRRRNAMGGSSFAARADKSSGKSREALILNQITAGNIPSFLRRLQPVTITKTMPNGRKTEITLCVMADYLAIGSDRNFMRVPMGMKAATTIAKRFGFVLPTPKIVDAIYSQTDEHLKPIPMTPGPEMTSTDYFSQHNRMVEQQRRAKRIPLGSLLAGQKKDLVITNQLRIKPDRVAIYGWQKPDGEPIQPLSTVHEAEYADYSHGVRLISTSAYVNGERRSLYDLLEDPRLASMLSKEGGIPNAAQLVAGRRSISARLGAYQQRAPKKSRWVN